MREQGGGGHEGAGRVGHEEGVGHERAGRSVS